MANNYNPDVLNCIANLSNDEVFTPPALANQVLDMLPQELFSNPATTFLDPFTKSGVFLREIVKRLDRGLEAQIPDRQQRIDHIMHSQVFGIACTELTAHLSRRSLYCSKHPDGPHSVSHFETPEGNILYRALRHTWEGNKCKYCGASREVYDRGDAAEQYAYQFIHTDNPENIFKMTFDVIIGNPPYQLNVGVEKENYAIAIYNRFVEQAKKLNPRFLSMIIPARWYAGGRGLDEFRDSMLNDRRIRIIHDFPDATECFPGVQIKAGVCYFLWNRDNIGDCMVYTHMGNKGSIGITRPLLENGCDTFIRYNDAVSVIKKVRDFNEDSFCKIVSPQTPFGIISSFSEYSDTSSIEKSIKYYGNKVQGYISSRDVISNSQWIERYKVYISAAYGAGEGFPHQILGKPFIGEPGSCCSQTYLLIGPFNNENECSNVISYIRTKFFRFMVLQKKNAQHAMRGVYQFVPLQDFSHPWTDEMLYKKYGLTDEEIAFIESMIRPME